MRHVKRLTHELRRRSVGRVVGLYVVGGWAAYRVALESMVGLGLPAWVPPAALILVVAGLPLVVATALMQPPREGEDTSDSLPDESDPAPPGTGVSGGTAHKGLTSAAPVLSWRLTGLLGALAISLLVLTTAGYMGMRVYGIGPPGTLIARGAVEAHDEILIADFASPTDALLGRTAAELIRTSLSLSGILRVAGDAEIAAALRRMERDVSRGLDPRDARELAEREGYGLVAIGEVASVGRGYVVTARLLEPATGEVLGRFRATASSADDFVDAIDGMAMDMRGRIGESLRSIRRSTPLAQVTTSSLDALKAYNEAVRLRVIEGRPDDAITWFERAIDLDSTFASAYRSLSVALHNLGRDPERQIALREAAYRHRDRTTPHERLRIDESALFSRALARPGAEANVFEEAIRLFEDFLRVHAPDPYPLINLGIYFAEVGRWQDGIDALERSLALRYGVMPHTNLITRRIWSGDLEGAEREIAALYERNGDVFDWYYTRSELALARGDLDGAHRILEEAAIRHSDQRRSVEQILARSAAIDAARGRWEAAQRHMLERIALRDAAGGDSPMIHEAAYAMTLALVRPDEAARARPILEEAAGLHPPGPSLGEWNWFVAAAFANLGDLGRARDYLDAGFQYAPGASHDAWSGALGRSSFLLAAGRPHEAIEAVRTAHRGRREHPDRRLLRTLAAAYVDADMPDSAIAAYERLLGDHDIGRGGQFLWLAAFPEAHRELGRLYEERGDSARAIYHLARFIELWRDADPPLQPQVEAARRRLAALRPD